MAILIAGIPYTEKKPRESHSSANHQIKQLERLTQDEGIQMKTLEINTRKMTTRGPRKEKQTLSLPHSGADDKSQEGPFHCRRHFFEET